jgi:hypothetical protein
VDVVRQDSSGHCSQPLLFGRERKRTASLDDGLEVVLSAGWDGTNLCNVQPPPQIVICVRA